jgi:predicted nucleic acid-binding Zn ribbon protein
MRALARAPKYRHESAAAFADELVGETPTAVTAVHRSPPTVRRRPWALPAAAALAAALIGLVLALSLASGSKEPPRPAAPPSASGTPAQQAHAFSIWLRRHAAGG